jgi:hypothetical protein
MKRVVFKTSEAAANQSWAMEADTISKNGSNPKSHTSRRNILMQRIPLLLFFILVGMCTNHSVYAQFFDCKKDKLDRDAIRFSIEPSSLTFDQQCGITVFSSKGKKVSEKDFSLTSNNTSVKINNLSFFVENNATGDPWSYLDGKLIEIDGTITIAHKKCNFAYDFLFNVKQKYMFDNVLNCQGEVREFAIVNYSNTLNKNLFVVIDINSKQLYLIESPITIDGSGIKGADGINGKNGEKGKNGVGILLGGTGTPDGGNGGDGGDGTDAGNGGNGGQIIVHLPQDLVNQVSINVDAGRGGRGGESGKGGPGGKPGKGGREGRAGRDGRNGQHGQHGAKGSFEVIKDDDIRKYFENIRHPQFNIENIVAN